MELLRGTAGSEILGKDGAVWSVAINVSHLGSLRATAEGI